MADTPRILIVEDHALLAESLALALRLREFTEVEICDPNELHLESVLACVEQVKPEVVLLDVFLGDFGMSIPMIAPICESGARVLVLTASQDRVVLARCLEAGASGVFDKAQAFDVLLTWVADAALGRTTMRAAARDELLAELDDHRRGTGALRAAFERLTDREAEVLTAVIGGANAEEIAKSQHVAVSTVRSHIRSILDKLGVNSQLAAVALARRAGWPE
jgi:DNA-binding NarL/FixJ family response regulator